MVTPNSCQKITLGEALNRLPGPPGERSVSLFEHGSLVVKMYAPRGNDPQTPHSRDEVYVVAQGSGEFQPYGLWEFEVKDPNGYILVFSELID